MRKILQHLDFGGRSFCLCAARKAHFCESRGPRLPLGPGIRFGFVRWVQAAASGASGM